MVKSTVTPGFGREVYHKQFNQRMFQQITQQVCEECPNVKYKREGGFVTVDIEKGMGDVQESE